MKIKCPACGAAGTDVEPIAPEHRGPSWTPLKGEEDYAFAVYGHDGGRAVRKCLQCGGGVYVKLLPPRYEAISSERWAAMQSYFDAEMAASEERLRQVFAASDLEREDQLELSTPLGNTRIGAEMEFEHEAHERGYLQTEGWLRQLYGESVYASEETPVFTLPTGVMVGVQAFGDDGACLDLWTWPFGSLTEFPEASFRDMLTLNGEYRFGSLNLQRDGGVIFEYIVDLDGLTKERLGLLAALMASSSEDIAGTIAQQHEIG